MKTKTKKLPLFIPDGITRISIREYIRNYKTYNDLVNSTGKEAIITNQDEDVVRITPITPAKKWTIEDLRSMITTGEDPELSNKIDEIAYGI